MSAAHDYMGTNLADPVHFPEIQPQAETAAQPPAPEKPEAMTEQQAMQWLVDVAALVASLPLDRWLAGIREADSMPLNDQQRDAVRVMKGTIKAAQPLQRFVQEEHRRLRARKEKADAA